MIIFQSFGSTWIDWRQHHRLEFSWATRRICDFLWPPLGSVGLWSSETVALLPESTRGPETVASNARGCFFLVPCKRRVFKEVFLGLKAFKWFLRRLKATGLFKAFEGNLKAFKLSGILWVFFWLLTFPPKKNLLPVVQVAVAICLKLSTASSCFFFCQKSLGS